MSDQIERRLLPGATVELRQTAEGGATLSGYAALYNSLSENLGGFREQIAPGAFDGSMDGDIRALWNHDTGQVLGRTPNTLRLSEDEIGLRFELDPPESAADKVEAIRRGDVSQMSFGFQVRPNGDRIEEDNDGNLVRTLTDVRLLEVSPVAFPAYTATSIDARSLDELRSRLEASKRMSEAQKTRIRMKQRLLEIVGG